MRMLSHPTKGVPSITDDPSRPEEVIRKGKKLHRCFEIFEDVSEPVNTFDNEVRESGIDIPVDPRSVQENLEAMSSL